MRKRRKLLWQLFPTYLVITLVSLAAVGWYATKAVDELSVHNTLEQLKSQAFLSRELLKGNIELERAEEIDATCERIGRAIGSRITVMLASGKVLGDTSEDPGRMDDHSTRPEVKQALAGSVGSAQRYSYTLNKTMVYVAVPVKRNGRVAGVIRASMPAAEMAQSLNHIYLELALECLFIAVLAAAVSLYVSYRINRPITAMKEGAVRFAAGDLDHRLAVPDSEEIGGLAEALNSMAAQLDDRISTITSQKNELEVILSSMIEAVVAVDNDGRITRINTAAEKFFGVEGRAVQGMRLAEAIRNSKLNRFAEDTLEATEPVERDIVFIGSPDRYIQAHGTTLQDARGNKTGALLALHDVTRLKALENVRRDFVANASHELKTPLTTIKGFLETLKDGALDDPKSAQRFLDIIIRNTDRLTSMTEDILSLSRIERQQEQGEILLERAELRPLMESAIKACEKKAREKRISVEMTCDDRLIAHMKPSLLEQAIINLVDNAIKYSGPGTTVIVRADKNGNNVSLSVEDQGRGIEKEHLERIFERFYRVDKARSRREGGTGLGLAIVKHIVKAHRGTIEVESEPGIGSTFTIHLLAT